MRRILPFLFLLTPALTALAGAPVPDKTAAAKPAPAWPREVKDLLDRFDAFQKAANTLQADFRQENQSSLLLNPVILEGALSIEKPSSIRYTYKSPDPLVFLIHSGWLTAHDPSRKLAARVDVRRYEQKVFRYMGLTEPVAELVQHFTPTVEPSQKPGCARLVLKPIKGKAQEKLSALVFELNRTTGAPAGLEILQADGDKVIFTLTNLRTNQALPKDTFQLTLPRGTRLTDDLAKLMDPVKR